MNRDRLLRHVRDRNIGEVFAHPGQLLLRVPERRQERLSRPAQEADVLPRVRLFIPLQEFCNAHLPFGIAGAGVQDAAARLADEHPGWPRFRVGVNSGEVLAGVVGGPTGHRKHGVVGDTVNLAARLESQAEAGQVVVGSGTASALPAGAVLERLAPLAVKGKSKPVEAFVLRSLGG